MTEKSGRGRFETVCVVLYEEDLSRAANLVRAAKRVGWTATSRSDVLRYALRQLTPAALPEGPPFGGVKLAPQGEGDD